MAATGKRSRRRRERVAAQALETRPGAAPEAASPWRRWLAAGAIVAAVAAVYAQVGGHAFTDFDDNDYVSRNPMVTAGLTRAGVAWAFTSYACANWHPLTWLSHMLDCQLWGVVAGRHLLDNVALHAANSVLLLLVLSSLTRRFWPSAVTAALFALHPLHVESVAWVAERKDVLSGLFWILTMGAYGWYAARPSAARLAAVAASLALGLMSKPMLVTMPFVLLLLDLWPLRRLPWPSRAALASWLAALRPLLFEKLPLFALVAASSAITFRAQHAGGAVQSLQRYPFDVRLANAVLAYGGYLWHALVPLSLSAYYPYRVVIPLVSVALAALVLVAATVPCVKLGPSRPYLLVGWLWFLGTLVPVIGLVQVGGQAMADRYTYVPLIGPFLAVALLVDDARRERPGWRGPATAGALAVLAVLALLAHAQAATWRDRETLFAHAIAVTGDNSLAQGNYADALRDQGRYQEALAHYQEALRIDPASFEAHVNIGNTLVKVKRIDEALVHYRQAAAIKPTSAMPWSNMALAHIDAGKLQEAVDDGAAALRLDPGYWEAHYNMGLALTKKGDLDAAVEHYIEALRLHPGHVESLLALGVTLQQKGRVDDAVARYKEAVALDPARAESHYDLGNGYFQQGKHELAAAEFGEAARLRPGYVDATNNMAVALFSQGKFAEAAAAFEQVARERPSPEATRNVEMARARMAGHAP